MFNSRPPFRSRRQGRYLGRLFAGFFAALLLLPSWHSSQALLGRVWPESGHPLLVGYFPQWGLYQDHPYRVKDLVLNGGAKMLDQINYAQGFVTNRRCSVADPNADLGTAWTAENSVSGIADNPRSPFRGYFHQLRELKRRYPHLKILISLEGKASSFAEDARPENRRAFVASCIDTFLRGNFEPGIHEPGLFDGVDIDWESPQQEDAANFQALLEEFRRQMQAAAPGSRLSVAVGPAPEMLPGTDFRVVAQLVDEVGVMNYDYTGPWSGRTGFLAPLFSRSGYGFHEGSIATSMDRYQAAGVPRKKLLMGLPFYGYSWTAVNKVNDGLFQNGRGVHDDRPWRYIRTLEGQFSVHRDPVSHAAWLFDGQTFWTCDDPVSVRYKASYARRMHLAGVMVWELSEDTEDAQLLHIAHRSLRHPMRTRAIAGREISEMQRSAGDVAAESAER
jgi:chitinase